MRRSLNTLIIASIVVWVSGCTGETVAIGVDKAGDVKEWFQRPENGSANTNTTDNTDSSVASIDGSSGNSNPYVDSVLINGEELVPIPETETSQLTVDPDFLFPTSRSIRLKVDLASTVGKKATLVLCTEFEEVESGYVIDYDSCPIRGVLNDGLFESDVSLVNHISSAIAIIWFPYQESEPLYRTFSVSEESNGVVLKEWLWN